MFCCVAEPEPKPKLDEVEVVMNFFIAAPACRYPDMYNDTISLSPVGLSFAIVILSLLEHLIPQIVNSYKYKMRV